MPQLVIEIAQPAGGFAAVALLIHAAVVAVRVIWPMASDDVAKRIALMSRAKRGKR